MPHFSFLLVFPGRPHKVPETYLTETQWFSIASNGTQCAPLVPTQAVVNASL